MSADFWAGYISGAAGIIIGNPLDVKKVRLQATQSPSQKYFPLKSSLVAGTAAPIFGYGFLNGILFAAYNRTEEVLNRALQPSASLNYNNISNSNASSSGTTVPNLWTTWLAGAVGGLAIWVISTPTELIKCRAQLASSSTTRTHLSTFNQTPSSSWEIARTILRKEGIRGLYLGGTVTALRDSIGYGFYFWAYEFCGRIMTAQLAPSFVAVNLSNSNNNNGADFMQETAKVLLCGGIAGVVTWASIYPLDVVKTRVQRQVSLNPATEPLLGTAKRKGAMQIARNTYREEGARAFFRGLGWCSVRAFMVNAVQWGVYELVMSQLSQSNYDREKELQY
ncbi:mitochondrial carrier [Xylaria scruposa]|nr:mitochondrial carrier [Xylaria scruposa]